MSQINEEIKELLRELREATDVCTNNIKTGRENGRFQGPDKFSMGMRVGLNRAIELIKKLETKE